MTSPSDPQLRGFFPGPEDHEPDPMPGWALLTLAASVLISLALITWVVLHT